MFGFSKDGTVITESVRKKKLERGIHVVNIPVPCRIAIRLSALKSRPGKAFSFGVNTDHSPAN
jgi:hypothetical protein